MYVHTYVHCIFYPRRVLPRNFRVVAKNRPRLMQAGWMMHESTNIVIFWGQYQMLSNYTKPQQVYISYGYRALLIAINTSSKAI